MYLRHYRRLHLTRFSNLVQWVPGASAMDREGGEWVFKSMDLALKSLRIADFCGKSSEFTDFENTVDCRLAVNYGMDSGLCLS